MPASHPFLDQFLMLLSLPRFQEAPALDLLPALQTEGTLEEAFLHFKRARLGGAHPEFRRLLEAAAARARHSRAADWHLDSGRLHFRLRYGRGEALANLNPGAFLSALCSVFERAGFPLALGLGRQPRPLLTLGHPLPLETVGLEEWADVVVQRRPEGEPSEWLARLRQAAPEGLTLAVLEAVPPYATPVLELSREALWAWPCPPALLPQARARLQAFMAGDSFHLEKSGKAEGAKVPKRVEVRPLVLSAAWEDATWVFTLRIAPGEALNPRKLLAGILGCEAADIRGLVRRKVVLAADQRLEQAERFESKLKNIYEDAVLLGGDATLVIVDEDDEEPLILG